MFQALLVSQELIRVAILWEEEWHEVLEEASRLYFGEGNTRAMLDLLLSKHEALARGPTTLREASFLQYFGSELQGACEYLKQYISIMESKKKEIPSVNAAPPAKRTKGAILSDEEKRLAMAWELYYSVFKKINQSLTSLNALDLSSVSPHLQDCLNLTLGVPGTYRVNGKAVRIVQVKKNVQVIKSKQRPRRIVILGEDGKKYMFVLKGHEDLRQDERAMQLFGLVNALLFRDRRTENDDLSIQRYAIVPLSPMVGLISWVPQCDTLHDLIKDYRDSKRVMLNVEHRLMQGMAPSTGYDSLMKVQKLEIFRSALDNTPGDDLAKILWHRSETSEAWLLRRTSYTRSLAVMSMVGYILGLGDRHPSNLMLNRVNGKVLHIDFGDCFEVAMHREKFPETVPFRLTRMLVNAMEVSGVEGTYRLTCEKVMSVLRENRDSLIAMLEAFVYDPLISWRLLYLDKDKNRNNPEKGRNTPTQAETVVGAGNASAATDATSVAPKEEKGSVASGESEVPGGGREGVGRGGGVSTEGMISGRNGTPPNTMRERRMSKMETIDERVGERDGDEVSERSERSENSEKLPTGEKDLSSKVAHLLTIQRTEGTVWQGANSDSSTSLETSGAQTLPSPLVLMKKVPIAADFEDKSCAEELDANLENILVEELSVVKIEEREDSEDSETEAEMNAIANLKHGQVSSAITSESSSHISKTNKAAAVVEDTASSYGPDLHKVSNPPFVTHRKNGIEKREEGRYDPIFLCTLLLRLVFFAHSK